MSAAKYTLTFTDRPASGKRYRQALKLMGADNVSIREEEMGETTPAPKKDNLPTTDESRALATMFNRRHSTEWSDREIALFRKARKRGVLTMENIAVLTAYYASERKKGSEGIHRRDLATFLANVDGELDRARATKVAPGRPLEFLPAKVVPMTPPEDAERIAALAREAAEEFRRTQNERTA